MTEPEPTDPIIGGGAAMLDSIEEFIMGFADLSMDVKRSLNDRLSRPCSRSRSRANSGSNHSTRTSSPNTASRAKVLNDNKDPTQSPIEAMPPSTSSLPSTNTTSDSSENKPVDDSRASRDLDKTETQPLPEPQQAVKAYPRKHARTISDIRDLDLEGLVSVAKSAAKLVNSGMRAPTAFTMAVAKGFHNTPLLYGDETVREQSKVTGLKSGLKAAGKVWPFFYFTCLEFLTKK